MTIPHHARPTRPARSAARLASQCCSAGDVVVLVGDLGAGKTTFAQGHRARARRRRNRSRARRSRSCRSTTAGCPSRTSTCTGSTGSRSCTTSGSRSCSTGAASRSSSGATRSRRSLPPDRVVVRLEAGRRRRRTRDCARARRPALARRPTLSSSCRLTDGSALMLLLGDRHRDPARRRRARVRRTACSAGSSSAASPTRPPRHAEPLAPAIEYCGERVRGRASTTCRRSRSASARACSPGCASA